MVDVHSHLLPGIDDGAADVEELNRMLLLYEGEGIDRVVATPHFMTGVFDNSYDSVVEMIDGLGLSGRVLPGQEVFLEGSVLLSCREGLVRGINGGPYLLVELSFEVYSPLYVSYDVRIGVNSRLDTIQAAILNVKLTAFIEHELEDVNRVFRLYTEKLKGIVETPIIPEGYVSSFAQYTIKLKNKEERDALQTNLKEEGIPSMVYYTKPMHKQGAFAEYDYDDNNFEVTNELCNTVLSLPMHPYLSEEDINSVIDIIKN